MIANKPHPVRPLIGRFRPLQGGHPSPVPESRFAASNYLSQIALSRTTAANLPGTKIIRPVFRLLQGSRCALSAAAQPNPSCITRPISETLMPSRPRRVSVRASSAKSLSVMVRANSTSASIAGVGTPAAAPRALIGISPVGTSSVMNL